MNFDKAFFDDMDQLDPRIQNILDAYADEIEKQDGDRTVARDYAKYGTRSLPSVLQSIVMLWQNLIRLEQELEQTSKRAKKKRAGIQTDIDYIERKLYLGTQTKLNEDGTVEIAKPQYLNLLQHAVEQAAQDS